MKKILSILISVIFTGLSVEAFAQAEPAPLVVSEAGAVSEVDGLAAWDKVFEVFSHPRCANCHVDDGKPRWSGAHYGETRSHGMYVGGGPDDVLGVPGLRCNTCHQQENSAAPHGPPGAEVWALAPKEFVWFEKSSATICNQVKDPARNGNRSLADIAEHVGHDALVLWGWAPGGTREPAPYSAAETADFVTTWAAAGAPCPVETAQAEAPVKLAEAVVVTDPAEKTEPVMVADPKASVGQGQVNTEIYTVAGDPVKGKRSAAICLSCHSVKEGGAGMIGPSLWNIVGRDIASVEGATYSKGLQKFSGQKWTPENLDAYIKKPAAFAPGTSMAINVKNDTKRTDIIAYLASLKD